MTTASEVAQWMLEQLAQSELYQYDAVAEIAQRFGEEFVYQNDNGNLGIDRKVLSAFRRLSENTVVWVRSDRYWRLRDENDEPGRQQDW
jgi:hypothetical protein